MCIHMFTNTYSVPLMHNALYLICYPQLLCWFTLVHIRSCVIQRLHYSIAVLMDDLRSDRQSNFFLKKWLSYTILQTAKCWVTVSVTCGHCLISMFKAWTLHGSSARYKHISMLHVLYCWVQHTHSRLDSASQLPTETDPRNAAT